ncbi:hypothetical protein GGS23DRAFT_610619 [Durotheca rogersii]|uniref:uncharacterized protein n=1 Tax=Durotheca rogersii TaxID=419775 RepID=UPI00221EEA2A|nr:uncharacterized protein GGS23DRAFT_610619 [Durotheca rogersii]KAI5862437.1 hypothetical protein GGS23DRAFT_610619 [Durotheca rogersii]
MSSHTDSVVYRLTILDLIARHIHSHPDAEAICSSNDSMSYYTLDNDSRIFAYHLVSHGVHSEVIVPICFEKSIWTVVAILAVLRAGGAFVLLDPAHPTERLETIIRKSKAKVAVTSRSQQGRIADLGVQALCLDKLALGQLELAESGPLPPVTATSAAYVVYTSGSTGQPKGVVVEHGSFCAGAVGHAHAMHMDASSRVLQFASYNFDASITEMLTTLVVGGTICVIAESDRLDSIAFTAAVTKMGATFALLTASFIDTLPVGGLKSLKTLVQGGEALPQGVLEKWADRITLMNAYGQVEASVVSTCTPPIPRGSSGSNIGKAVVGRCWVVDPDDPNRRMRQGEAGELLVEGPHVARGYLDDPKKTQQSFISRPTWHTQLFPAEHDVQALRFYKTGDLVVEEADGSFAFAGRKDEQVKVNGQRIELGEIEHQFKRVMNSARDLVVELVKRKTSGGYRGILVGFVALNLDWTDNDDAANRRLLDSEMGPLAKQVNNVLPNYMMPASFVPVRRIPISINGKIDRKALRALGEAHFSGRQNQTELPGPKRSALSQVEQKLRKIWSRVLNVREADIDRTSIFQTLGGDSISAMQVVSQAATDGLRVTAQRILQRKTIEALASDMMVKPNTQRVEAEEEEYVEEPFGLSPIQRLFFALSPEGNNHNNISFLLRINRTIEQDAIESAVGAVVSRNAMLRARFLEWKPGSWLQYVSTDVSGSYRITTHELDNLRSDPMPIIRKSQRSISIKDGPLLRVDLITTRQEQVRLLFICAHHLVTDFVSWRIILQQLEEYIQTGKIVSPKSYPFQNWCREQERQIRHSHSQQQSSAPSMPDYNFWGMQGTPNTYGDSVTKTIVLDKALSSEILSSAHKDALQVEVVDMILSAVMYSFQKIFYERQLPPFFVEGHGREPFWDDSIDLSSTMGWFTTILPIILSRGDCNDPLEALRQVKSQRAKFSDNGLAQFAANLYSQKRDQSGIKYSSMEVTFNYAGIYQQLERQGSLFSEVTEHTLMNLDGFGESLPRFGLIEVLGNVHHGHIKLSFTFNKRMQHQDRISLWIEECQRTLQVTTSHLNPSWRDFPLLGAPSSADIQNALSTMELRIEDVEDIYPCSPMQNGMLISRVTERGSYLSQLYLEIRSNSAPIDVGRLKSAWQAVVDHHAALRTLLMESVRGDGSFDQVVLRRSEAAITQVDDRLEEQFVASWPLNRPQHHLFLRFESPSHLLLRLDISHVLIDGNSTATLLRDLQRAYDSPRILTLEPHPLYSLYIKHTSSHSPNHSLDYWRRHLSGCHPCILPESGDSKKGRLEVAHVPTLDSMQTMNFCRKNGITVSDLLKTAWAIVLHWYTGSTSPVFGSLSTTRGEEHEKTVGVFSNIQPFSVKIGPDSTILRVLESVQSDSIEQMAHNECSLADIMNVVDMKDAPRTGLFNTAMSLQKLAPIHHDSSIDIKITREIDPTEFAATFLAYVSNSSIELSIQHWTSKLSTEQASNIAATLSTVVQTMIRNPDSTVKNLNVISERDWSRLGRWNARLNSCAPVNACIHQLVKDVSMKQPKSLAVDGWDGKLTYEELDCLSSKLAGHLHHLGVRPESKVPVCMEKSVWTIVGMLSVLKAGGAFVPFDPEAPLARMLKLIGDLSASLVIASPKTAHRLQDHTTQVVLSLEFILNLPERSFQAAVSPENLAYVMFTSGSTGEPKGIMMQHSQILASSAQYCQMLGLDEQSCVLQFSAYTFDASIFEIWSTLISGGRVCQISEEQRMDDVEGAIGSLSPNTMFMTPAMLGLMQPHKIPSIRTVVTGGEVIPQSVLSTWAPAVRLIEAYGPTETAVFATFQMDLSTDSDRLCIGQSFCCRAWVVDAESLNLVPIGAAGELWLEGPSLARGYLNAEKQTAESFVYHENWLEPGKTCRFYRTGDLVRMKTDGSLQFVGRKDSQVKIRGQRIELSEVEHQASLALEYRTPVAAVTVNSLLALLVEVGSVSDQHASSTVSLLQAELPERLPRFMVPSIILLTSDSFPRLSSGKLDRKSLQVMATRLREEQRLKRMAKRADEPLQDHKLIKAVASVLKLESSQIKLSDNFYQLGGNSILAMRLVAATRAEGLRLTVASALKNPVLRDMEKTLVPIAQEASTTTDIPPFGLLKDHVELIRTEAVKAFNLQSEDEIEDIYPATPMQEALIVESSKNPLAYVAQHVVELPSDPDFSLPRFRAAWERCVEQYHILRTRIFQSVQTRPPRPMQVVMRGVSVNWEYGDDLQSHLENIAYTPGESVNVVAIIHDSNLKARYFVWVAHHSLYDGFSLSALLQRVHDLYSGNTQVPKTIPFKNYVKYANEVQDSRAAMEFWRSYLAGASPSSYPPVRAGAKADSTLDFQIHLPEQSEIEVTLTTILRVAWALTIATCNDEAEDIVFGGIVSGRNAPLDGADTVMGPTITATPVRVTFSSGELAREVLLRVQKQAFAMIPHEVLSPRNIRALSPDAARASSFGSLLVVQPPLEASMPYKVQSNAVDVYGSFSYPLNIVCTLVDKSTVKVDVTYASAALESSHVEQLMDQFDYITRSLVDDRGDLVVGNIGSMSSASPSSTPGPVSTRGSSPDIAPLTPMEIQLRIFWAELLEHKEPESIGSSNNFIELGGDSITAMQLSGIARRQGYALQVPDILHNPILRDMAVCMAVLDGPGEKTQIPPFSLLPTSTPRDEFLPLAAADISVLIDSIEDMYPCTPLQEGLMATSSSRPGAYIARLVVDMKLRDIESYKAAWESVVTSHPILRTRIVHLGTAGMVQVVLKPSLPSIDWRTSTNIDDYIKEDQDKPMGFGDSLTRYGIVVTGNDVKFIWTAHHAIYDGATVALLSEAVHNAHTGKYMEEPPKFNRFVEYLTKLDTDGSDEFWKRTLAGSKSMPFPLVLSLDHASQANHVVERRVILGRKKPAGITMASLLQTAWAFVLARYSGSDDVVLGVVQSGRLVPVPDIDRMPGPVITTVPLFIRLDRTQTLTSLLYQVQSATNELIPHCHRGLQNIREVSDDARQACDFRSLLTIFPQETECLAEFDLRRALSLTSDAADFHNYPLALECAFTESDIRLTATHDTSVIEPRQMDWMLQQLDNVLQQLVSVDIALKPVARMELLTRQDYDRLYGWGRNALARDQANCPSAWVVDLRYDDWLAPTGVVGELVVEERVEPYKNGIASTPRWLERFGLRNRHTIRTGQLARFNCDGSLEIIGPKSTLVESNGRRFIARDIEQLASKFLRNMDVSIQVVKGGDGSGRDSLIASVAWELGQTDNESAQKSSEVLLRTVGDRLKRVLPSFMVPSTFVPMRRFHSPTSDNTDSTKEADLATAFILENVAEDLTKTGNADSAEIERCLLPLCESILGLEGMIGDDNFLNLGGDSLDAMKLVAAARHQGIILTVRDIFDNAIISRISEVAKFRPKSEVVLPPFSIIGDNVDEAVAEVAAYCHIERELIEDVYPSTPLQEGLMALSNMERGAYIAEYIVPVPDAEAAKAAWVSLVTATPILRTRIVQTDKWGCLQVVVEKNADTEVGSARSLDEYLVHARKDVMLPGQRLAKASIVTEGNTSYLVLFVHHALFDGWSWGMLLDRLYAHYQGLPLSPAQPYNRFIHYLHKTLDSKASEDFWRSYLEGANPAPFPPTSKHIEPLPEAHESRRIRLDRPKTHAHTTTTIIQAAWALLVGHYTASEDAVFGATLSGRTVPLDGVQDIIGPTFATIPMRFRLNGARSVSELLDTAQSVSMSPMQHFGLQRIRQISASTRAACEFGSLLVVQPASSDDSSENFFLRGNDSKLVSGFTNYGTILLCQMLPDSSIDASIVFDSRVVSQRWAKCLLGRFDRVLQQLCGDADIAIGSVDYYIPDDPDGETLKIVEPEDTPSAIPIPESPEEAAQPKGSTKQILVSLWARVLDVGVSQITDDITFAELGGDSITAMKLSSKARRAGIALSVADIMKRSRFADVAAACRPLTETAEVSEYEYQPFMTFSPEAGIDQFLREAVGAGQDEIEDIIEATSTQKGMNTSATSQHGGSINHVWLDFRGPVDAYKLKAACSVIVARHSILRTVFVPHGEKLMQVVFRQHTPQWIDVYADADQTIETTTAAILARSQHEPERHGRHGLRFSFVSGPADESRLVVRIPHALYDGISMPLILEDLRVAYEGQPLPAAPPSFAAHLHARRRLVAAGDTEAYWREHLRGSRMTRLVRRTSAAAANVDQHLTRSFSVAGAGYSKYALETVLHAAWALVLGRLSGTADVVFARVAASRDVPLAGALSVCGPTVNTVPVRVRLGRGAATRHELLAAVEDDRLAGLRHEHLETEQLVAKCCDAGWAGGSDTDDKAAPLRFGSLLLYNNLDAAQTFERGEMGAWRGAECRIGAAARPWDAADVQLAVMPEGPAGERARVDFVFAGSVISRDAVATMMEMFCQNVEMLAAEEDGEIEGLDGFGA